MSQTLIYTAPLPEPQQERSSGGLVGTVDHATWRSDSFGNDVCTLHEGPTGSGYCVSGNVAPPEWFTEAVIAMRTGKQ